MRCRPCAISPGGCASTPLRWSRPIAISKRRDSWRCAREQGRSSRKWCPNGSGKTTTVRLMLGLLRPMRGSITVLGAEVPRDIPRILARTGYVPEQPHLYTTLTVDEALRFHSVFYPTWDWNWANELVGNF